MSCVKRTWSGPRAVWGLVRLAGCVKTGAQCGPARGRAEGRGLVRLGRCVRTGAPAGAAAAAAAMAQQQMTSSQKALMLELKSLQEEPVEGFRITLVDESDLYNWEVAIFGPPNTLYEGGYFKVSPPPQTRLPWRRPLLPDTLGCFRGQECGARVSEGASSPWQPPSPTQGGRKALLTECLFFVIGAGAGGQTAPGNRKASLARVVAPGEEGGCLCFVSSAEGVWEERGSVSSLVLPSEPSLRRLELPQRAE